MIAARQPLGTLRQQGRLLAGWRLLVIGFAASSLGSLVALIRLGVAGPRFLSGSLTSELALWVVPWVPPFLLLVGLWIVTAPTRPDQVPRIPWMAAIARLMSTIWLACWLVFDADELARSRWGAPTSEMMTVAGLFGVIALAAFWLYARWFSRQLDGNLVTARWWFPILASSTGIPLLAALNLDSRWLGEGLTVGLLLVSSLIYVFGWLLHAAGALGVYSKLRDRLERAYAALDS